MNPTMPATTTGQRLYPEVIVIEDDPVVEIKQEPGVVKQEPQIATHKKEEAQKVKAVSERRWSPKEINIRELEGTLSEKMVKPQNNTRTHKAPLKEPKIKQKSIIKFVKDTLKDANQKWNEEDFKGAAELYSQVASHPGSRSHLSKNSFIQVLRDLYQSHLEQWCRADTPQVKLECIKTAEQSLLQYLKQETNRDLKVHFFRDFSFKVFEYAVSMTNDYCKTSFSHWALLIEVYLTHPSLVEQGKFHECLDDVFHNMTVCIIKFEEEGGVSGEMVQTLREFLAHQLVAQGLKDLYIGWLDGNLQEEGQGASGLKEALQQPNKKDIHSITEEDECGVYGSNSSFDENEAAVFLAAIADENKQIEAEKMKRVEPQKPEVKTGDFLVDWFMDQPIQTNRAVYNPIVIHPFCLDQEVMPLSAFHDDDYGLVTLRDEPETQAKGLNERIEQVNEPPTPLKRKRDGELDVEGNKKRRA